MSIPPETLLWSRVDREATRFMEKHHQIIGEIRLSPDLYALVADQAENGLDPFGIGVRVSSLPKGTKDTIGFEPPVEAAPEKSRRRAKRYLG
jgi:hypothetical protein